MLEITFGIIAGIITGLGMGGGTILILLLSLFLGMEQHVAQATNLIFFIPTAIAAIVINGKQKNVNIKLGIEISLYGIIGAILGAIISENLEAQTLRKWFAVFIFMIALHEIYTLWKVYRKKEKRHNKTI
ncbi:MAG: TSUP family transporter [Clostridia bacterium]